MSTQDKNALESAPRWSIGRPPAGWHGDVWSVVNTRTQAAVVRNVSRETATFLVKVLNVYGKDR